MKLCLLIVAGLVFSATIGPWAATATTSRQDKPASHSPKQEQQGILEPGQAHPAEKESPEATTQTASVRAAQWTHPEVELRGIWLPGKELLGSTESIVSKLDKIAKANFNAVMPDAYFKGYVIYPNSKHLPQLPEAKGSDPLAFFTKEAHKRGLQVHVWLEYGFYAYHTPDATKNPSMGPWLDAHPELLSVSANGNKYIHNPAWGDFYSMCPANPRCHELIANIATEILERYPVDGINLDRIRFAGENYCYCDYCKEHFQKDTGMELVAFPKDSAGAKRFLEWERQQLVKAVETIRKKVKETRPNAILTSYVVPPAEKDNKAQPWDLWAKHRLLDAIAVSMYGRNIVPDAEQAVRIFGSSKDLLVAAISCEVPSQIYLENIEKARRYAPLGQITWYSGQVDDDLEGLREGPYAKPAKIPFIRDEGTSTPSPDSK
jgi:uncharacterized lipoprotein YddW (UPF0748 family)